MEINAVVVFVEYIAVVAVRRVFQNVRRAPEAGIAAAIIERNCARHIIGDRIFRKRLFARQMPFAGVCGFIARFLEVIREGFDIARQHDVVFEASDFRGVFAGLEQRAAGAAHRLRRESPFKARAFLGERVQIRGDRQLLTVASARVRALLIGKEEQNIRFLRHGNSPLITARSVFNCAPIII